MGNYTTRSIFELNRILNLLINDFYMENYHTRFSSIPLSKNQLSILKILKIGGPFLVSEIADIMHLSRAAASKNIDNLVNNKLVRRRITAKDRRKTSVSILEAGEKIVDELESLRTKKQNIALASFSEEEQHQLSQLLSKYVQQCLAQEDDLGLICMKCNGSISDECVLIKHNVKCRFNFE